MQSKPFDNLEQARKFCEKLEQGAILTTAIYAIRRGRVIFSWSELKLSACMGACKDITPERLYHVFRESAAAYFIRNDAGKIVKVNRFSLMGGAVRFKTN